MSTCDTKTSSTYLKKVYQANTIHNILGKVWVPLPLQWNSKESKWEYKDKWAVPFLVASVLSMGSASLACGVLLDFGKYNPNVLLRSQMVSAGLQLSGVLCMLLGDYIVYKDGREMAISANWSYKKAEWLTRFGRSKFPKKCALVSHGVIVGLTVSVGLFPVGLVVSNLDPLGVLQKLMGIPGHDNFFVKLYRTISTIHLSQAGVAGFRAMYLTTIMEQLHRIEMLKALLSRLPIKEYIGVYRENAYIGRVIYEYEFRANKTGFVTLYFAILLTAGIIIMAVGQQKYLLAAVAVTFAIGISGILQIAFNIGCIFFTTSGKVLQKWKKKAIIGYKRRRNQELIKVLKSIQPITVPAGGAGIVDRGMIITFWDKVLGDLIDAIVFLDNL